MLIIIGVLTFFFIVMLRQTLHEARQLNATAQAEGNVTGETYFQFKQELKNKTKDCETEYDYNQL